MTREKFRTELIKTIPSNLLITMALIILVEPAFSGVPQKSIPQPRCGTDLADEKHQEGRMHTREHTSNSELETSIAPNLRITIPSAMFNGVPIEFSLDYYSHPGDPAGHYWKLDPDTLKLVDPVSDSNSEIRIPAEWEPHAATWMQWPKSYEATMRPAFAHIIDVIQSYEAVHILANSQTEKAEAMWFLAERGVPDANITWHVTPLDNSWLRDNGPIYATDGVTTWIQNWKFDAWGGNFGRDVGYENDNRVPAYVG